MPDSRSFVVSCRRPCLQDDSDQPHQGQGRLHGFRRRVGIRTGHRVPVHRSWLDLRAFASNMPALKTRRPRVSNEAQILEVSDLTGGVNRQVTPTLLKANEAVVLRNVSLEEPGAWQTHLGYSRFSSGTLGATRPQGGGRAYFSSQVFTLIASSGNVYNGVSTLASTSATLLTGRSTSAMVFFQYDRDIVAVLDSSNRPLKSTNGSSWTNLGIDRALTPVTVSTLSSGACSSGEYEFGFTYKQRSLSYESNLSSLSTITLSGSTGAFHLTAAASTEAHVDAIVWYARDVTAGEPVLRKISSQAATASTVRVTDTNWTANDEAPTTHGVITNGRFGAVWKNRWWIVDNNVRNRLRFSELFLPQAFDSTFYLDLPFRFGDAISAVVPLGDYLVIYGRAGETFVLVGQTSLDFEVRVAQGSIAGCLGPRAWCKLEQGIVHAAAEGVYIFDGITDRLLSNKIEVAWRDFIANTGSAELEQTPVIYEFRHKVLRIGVAREYPYGTAGEWILDLRRSQQAGEEAWYHTNRPIGGYISFEGDEAVAGNRGELLTWSNTNGILWKESTGTSANSSNLTAEYEGPTLTLGLHRMMATGVHIEYEPHGGTLTGETVVDGVSQGSLTIGIGAGVARLDTAIIGTDVLAGAGRRKAYLELPTSAEGRSLTQKFTYAGQERMKVFAYSFDVVPETHPSHLTE